MLRAYLYRGIDEKQKLRLPITDAKCLATKIGGRKHAERCTATSAKFGYVNRALRGSIVDHARLYGPVQ